jgi:hypothetical protein
MDFFNGGRDVPGLKGCRFVPVACPELRQKGQFAVVFYLEAQTQPGQRSQTGNLNASGKRNTTPPGRNTVAYAAGMPWGTVQMSDKGWHIEGQHRMNADELLDFCKKGGITRSNWNTEDPKIDKKIVDAVKAKLK